MKRLITLIVLMSFFSIGMMAQTAIPQDLRLVMLPAEEVDLESMGVEDLEDPVVDGNISLMLEYKAVFQVTSILDIQSIEIKLGTTEGGNNVESQSYAFDGSPNAPYTYVRNDSEIELGLGVHPFEEIIYCEVHLVYSNGQESVSLVYPPSQN